jgi:hypothetical protein
VGAGVAAFGHHHPTVTGRFDNRWFAGPRHGGGRTQAWEEVLATGLGGVGVSGWGGPDDRAVGGWGVTVDAVSAV